MNHKAKLLQKERIKLDEDAFVEVMVWEVPQSVRASAHRYKYTLAYVVDGLCVLRYDNEAGKGDHKHVRDVEAAYTFSTLDQLIEDFWADVAQL